MFNTVARAKPTWPTCPPAPPPAENHSLLHAGARALRPLAFTRTHPQAGAPPQPPDDGGSNMMRVFYQASLGARARTRGGVGDGAGQTTHPLSCAPTRALALPRHARRHGIHRPSSLDRHCAPMIAWPRHHLGRHGDVTGTDGVCKQGASPASRSGPISHTIASRVARVCAARDRPAGGHGRRSRAVAAGGRSGCRRDQPAAW